MMVRRHPSEPFHRRKRRKALVIAYAFPPTGGSGVQRPAKFVKYLPDFGWEPVVWTVDSAEGFPRDPTLGDDLPPNTPIYFGRGGGGIRAVRRTLRGWIDPAQSQRRGLQSAASRLAMGLDWRLENWMAARSFPDDCAGWARRSLRPLMDVVAGEEIDIIFSTFSPASSHLLAMEIKRRTRLPWVSDFRDLWTDDCRYHEPSAHRRAAHRRLEQEILETADVVVGVTPRQTEILSDHVPDRRAKFVTITNGFDPDDFEVASRRSLRSDDRFTLTYVGRFDLTRTRVELFDALKSFADSLGTDCRRFRFLIVGPANRKIREHVAETGVEAEFVEFVPHAEAVRHMIDADALLLTSPDGPRAESVIRAKVFEYLAASRPILSVGPTDGEAQRIVASCDAGLCVPFDSSEIRTALRCLFDSWRSGKPRTGCRSARLAPYSRIELTKKLAEQFDQLIGSRGRAPTVSREMVETGAP